MVDVNNNSMSLASVALASIVINLFIVFGVLYCIALAIKDLMKKPEKKKKKKKKKVKNYG